MNMHQNYSFDKLQRKYNFFLNPVVQISVNGKLMHNKYLLLGLEVELTIHSAVAGAARFTVENMQNLHVLGQFPLMAKVKVEMGYENDKSIVFEGVILERTMSITNTLYSSITVICLDQKVLMRMNNPYRTYSSAKNYSSVVRQIVSEYKLPGNIDKSSDFIKPITLTQYGVSDFDYIVKMAQETGFEFFVHDQTFYFRKPRSVEGMLIVLGKECFLQIQHRTSMDKLASSVTMESFSLDNSQEQSVSCRSVQHKVGDGITGIDILKENGGNFSIYESHYKNHSSISTLKEAAMIRLQENSMMLTELSIRINGLPELIPGRFLAVKDVVEDINNTYYIEKVNHVFSNKQAKNPYYTEIICTSNTIKNSAK